MSAYGEEGKRADQGRPAAVLFVDDRDAGEQEVQDAESEGVVEGDQPV